MHFTKMQGIGNDYIYFDCTKGNTIAGPGELAVKASDRHFGIGGDGIVLICSCEEADYQMRIFNADGSEAEMCGNASRCVAKYLYERGLTEKTDLTLKTASGIRKLHLNVENGVVRSVCVDMGEPIFRPSRIPVRLEGEKIIDREINIGGFPFRITCVSMGNPHCVIFTDDPDSVHVQNYGPLIENSDLFPCRTNVEFASVMDHQTIRMRVWERGSGETLACGTGACATLAASVLNGYSSRTADILLKGGILRISWNQKDNHIYMEGPAEFLFDGDWEI